MKLLPVTPALRFRLTLPMVAWLVLAVAPLAGAQEQPQAAENESTEAIYQRFCSSCHGKDLSGAGAQSMVDGVWQFGSGNGALFRNIKFGITSRGMPEYQHALSDKQINDLIGFIKQAQDRADVEPPPLPTKLETRHYDVGVTQWIDGGLEVPWSLVFIDDHRAIISERPGRLRMVTDGKLNPEPVRNTPECLPEGQGGYMDVALDPDYANNGWVYLSYSDGWKNPAGKVVSMTRVARGKIVDNEWTNTQDVYRAGTRFYSETRHHYGSRIAFDHQGRMLLGVGERGAEDLAQDLRRPNGKIHRVWPDGRIPADNPYVDGRRGLRTIYSYGHRNPQGLAVHPETGEIWETEHGPMGGDEVNIVLKGENYGWPLATYGINYDGNLITENLSLEGTRQPVSFWVPSIAVCGTRFCVGDEFPRWRNNLLVGGLAYEELRRLVVAEGRVMHQELLLKNAGRVRDVACDPSGAVYVVLNKPDIVLKLTNEGRALRQ